MTAGTVALEIMGMVILMVGWCVYAGDANDDNANNAKC
jgi:hypothetical protein